MSIQAMDEVFSRLVRDKAFRELLRCDPEKALANLIGRPDLGGVWLIGAAGGPVGYLVLTWGYSLEFGGRDAFLDELYLEAAWRGQGLGRQAMRFAEEACRANGVLALHLEVERENVKAQAFYDKTGFENRAHYFLMSKRLAQPVGRRASRRHSHAERGNEGSAEWLP